MTDLQFPFPRSWLLAGNDIVAALDTPADRIVIGVEQLATMTGLGRDAGCKVFLRLGTSQTDSAAEQIDLVVKNGLGGLMLDPPCRGADVQKMDVMLSAAEAVAGVKAGRSQVVALAANHPTDILTLAGFQAKSARLLALGGAGETIRRALAVESSEAEPVRQARGLLVIAAAAAGVAALADAEPDLSASDFEAICHRDKKDGFAGKLVTTAAQAAIANTVFGSQGSGGR